MLIKEVVVEERPREKALSLGVENLNNSELLAIILRTGTKDISVLELSLNVLNRYQGLNNLAHASLDDLIKIKGIKEVKAIELLACIELAKRLQQLPSKNKFKIRTPNDVFIYLGGKLKFEMQENFIVLFLDTKNHVIYEKTMYIGSLDTSVVHPRDIFREAIKCSCARIVCAHNHPSGDCTPSMNDIEITKILEQTGEIMQIQLVDHVIIGFNSFISLRQQGILAT